MKGTGQTSAEAEPAGQPLEASLNPADVPAPAATPAPQQTAPAAAPAAAPPAPVIPDALAAPPATPGVDNFRMVDRLVEILDEVRIESNFVSEEFGLND